MAKEYSNARIRKETYQAAKIRAAELGISIINYVDAWEKAYHLLREIVKESPYQTDIYNEYPYCRFCSKSKDAHHALDCVYALARQIPGINKYNETP